MELNAKQRLFVENYISNNFNGTQAAIAAGYSKKTAVKQASRLLTKEEVRNGIKKRIREVLSETETLTIKWVNKVTEIAFSDPIVITNKQGDPVTISHRDQLKALDLLAKYLSLYADLDIHFDRADEKKKINREERRERILKLTEKLK